MCGKRGMGVMLYSVVVTWLFCMIEFALFGFFGLEVLKA
jgi:hypothetical protein